nr:protein YffB-like [Nerophis lumbriciformis]
MQTGGEHETANPSHTGPTMIELYGLKNCSTCKKACAWMAANGVTYQFTDYRDHPIKPAALRRYAKVLGWAKLLNRASMTWRKLSDEQKQATSDSDWLALVAEHPTLIRRPLAIAGKQVLAGFKETEYANFASDAD